MRFIAASAPDAHAEAVITRAYELARNGEPDDAELSRLDAEIQAGLRESYGDPGPELALVADNALAA